MVLHTNCEAVITSFRAVVITGTGRPFAGRAYMFGEFIFDAQTPMQAIIRFSTVPSSSFAHARNCARSVSLPMLAKDAAR